MDDVSIAVPPPEAFAAILQRPPGPPAAIAHTLDAHALGAADSFSELLALRWLDNIQHHPYQIETVRRVLRTHRGRALLADEVGLGKTIEALMIVREYQLRGRVRRVLVLTPPSLVGQWAGELAEKARVTARTTDEPLARQDPEAFWADEGPSVTVASLTLARSSRHAPLVTARPWDLVVLDEAHRVKNRATAGWRLANGLRSRFLLLLTATPVEKDLEELYNLITLLKPGHFATPAAYRREFVDRRDPTSPRHADRLRALLAEVMVRNTRAGCGLRLPPRYVTTISVDPTEAERRLYQEALVLLQRSGGMTSSTLLLEAGSSPAAVRATLAKMDRGDLDGIRQAAAAVAATRKADALIDIVRAHAEPVLVFSRFRQTVAYLAEVLGAAGVPAVSFHGGLGAADKQAALAAFRAGARVLLATDAAAEGHNLHFCHLLVNFDLPWNPMLIEQRIGRLHRFGQTQEVTVYNLCTRGTIEERVLDVLDRRVRLFELVVGEMDMVLGNLADERDLEERILALYAAARDQREIDAGFDAIADELLRARGVYERARAVDDALFGQEFEA